MAIAPSSARRLASAGCLLLTLALGVGCGRARPDTLAIGAPVPAFSLKGVDGRIHTLGDYADHAVLAVIFTCNHCPTSQLYEQRIQQLHRDYASRGVAVVAINPERPDTASLKDLAYSDVPDSLDGMIERSTHRRLDYPYLYDGDSQAAATAFKVATLPQAFVFDQQRRLQYVGRIDDDASGERVKSQDVRAAFDALLAHQPVRVTATSPIGCPLRRSGDKADAQAEERALASEPVLLQPAGPAELKRLRANEGGPLTLVNFWATWCGPCISEFPELLKTFRTFRSRGLDLVTISVDVPEARPSVIKWLEERHASNHNFIFATDDTTGLQQAFDPALPSSVPFTLLLGPSGDVRFQQEGAVQFLDLRRAILANLPDDARSPGLQRYWTE